MQRLFSMPAAIVMAALTLVAAASAQQLPAPPSGTDAASTAIFDALLSIERAQGSNPNAVGPATLSYNAAIQQYATGNLTGAQYSALTAISQTGGVPLPAPSLNPPAIPEPAFVQMPQVLNTNQADAEAYMGLARRAITLCGAPGAPPPAAVQQQFAATVNALVAKNTAATAAASTSVVNQCAAASQAYAMTMQSSRAPIAMGTFAPEPIATLGPDPALQSTPAPLMVPSATPVPAHRGFRL
jgi:hypothetical protein